MKSKKWLIAGIISIVLVIAEAAAMFLFVLPGMYKGKMVEALESGDGAAAAEYYDKVNFLAAGDKDDVVKGFLTKATNDYIDGKGSYEDAVKKIQAVEKIGSFKGKLIDNYKVTGLKREIEIYDDTYSLLLADDSTDVGPNIDDFFNVYYAYDAKDNFILKNYKEEEVSTREEYMDKGLNSYLKEKYDSYNAGSIGDDEMISYVDAAIKLFTDSQYAFQLDSEMYYVKYYKEGLEITKGKLDEGKYIEAYDSAAAFIDYPADEDVFPRYKGEFESLRDSAYNDVKEKGYAAALGDAQAGNAESAEKMMGELRRICGDDIDLSEIEKLITPEWKKAYLAYMANWDSNLRTACTSSNYVVVYNKDGDESITSSENLDYETYKPTSMVLYDIDADGTPEMILRSEATEYLIAYDGENAVLVGLVVSIDGFGEAGQVIAIYEENGDGYHYDSGEIFKYSDGTLVCETFYYFYEDESEKEYCVDTYEEETDEETYKEAKEKVVNANTIAVPASSPINSYESVINGY